MRSRFKLYSWLLRTPPKKKYRYFEPCPSAWIYVFRRIFLEIYHIPMSWSTWREQFGCGWTKLVQPISYNCPIRIFRISKSSHTITQVWQSSQNTIYRNVPFSIIQRFSPLRTPRTEHQQVNSHFHLRILVQLLLFTIMQLVLSCQAFCPQGETTCSSNT